jgi:hypothetical protein
MKTKTRGELFERLDDNIMFAEDLDVIGKNLNLKTGGVIFNQERASNFVIVGIVGSRCYFLKEALFDELKSLN